MHSVKLVGQDGKSTIDVRPDKVEQMQDMGWTVVPPEPKKRPVSTRKSTANREDRKRS